MMKCRKCVMVILLCLLVILPVQAAEFGYVFDEVGLLTPEEALELDNLAGNISYQYDCGVYVVTTWDYSAYGATVRDAAENFFLMNDLGFGSDDNGVLLMLSMADRDYALIAHGKTGNAAFTDYGKDVLSDAFLDDFGDNDWYSGFADYASYSGTFLDSYRQGTPVDVNQDGGSGLGFALVMILLVPAAIAGIACGIMASSMKTARKKTHADDYRQGIQLTGRHDRFMTRTVVRQKIESFSSGGTTVNSRGFSRKSGKF